MIIKSVHTTCNSSDFFPCACCDPTFHHCVHNSINLFGYISTCSVFKKFNPTCKLDTSIYCCVAKELARTEMNNDNVTLFNKYCKKNFDSHDPVSALVNRRIPSCDPMSKQCYDWKNPIIPALLPIPKRLPASIILSPSRNKQPVTDMTSSISIPENIDDNQETEKDIKDATTQPNENRQDIDDNARTSNEDEIDNYKSTNRAITESQSIWSLILLAIIKIAIFVD